MYIGDKEKLEKFIELRNKYISLLEENKISKYEFNLKNHEIFKVINLRPFKVLDSFDKALYNYNYYNSKAKMELENFKNYKSLKNEKKAKIANNNKLNNYYHKDEAIKIMIELEKPEFINAYYIDIYSKALNSKIFEIVFFNKDKIILHTQNEEIKEKLIELNCFDFKKRKSLISSYINN